MILYPAMAVKRLSEDHAAGATNRESHAEPRMLAQLL